MSGQVQGATSGTPGHMADEGAKALGCIWEQTRYFKHSAWKHWVPRPAAPPELSNLAALLHAMSRMADPTALGTRGYEREAAALRCQRARYGLYCSIRQEPSKSRTLCECGRWLARRPGPAEALAIPHVPDHAPHPSSMAKGWQRHHRNSPHHPLV